MLVQLHLLWSDKFISTRTDRHIVYSKRLLRTIQAGGGGKSRLQQKRYISRLSSCKAQCSKPTKKLQKIHEFAFLIIEYFEGNDNQQYPKNIFFKTKYWLSCMRGEKSRFKKNNFSGTFSDFTAHCKPLRSPCLPMTSMML